MTFNDSFEIESPAKRGQDCVTRPIHRAPCVLSVRLRQREQLRCTSSNGIKYKTGDFVTEHIDTSGGESRILSCSLLLNDDYKGGELAFFNKRYKHKGSKGDLVIFPSSFTYPHEVLPVKSGTRYSIVTWIR